jgi:MFS family permease
MLGVMSGLALALTYSTLGIPVARWADRGDRKLIITLALVVWSAMTAICGLAQNFWQLALARFGVGAGEAGSLAPAQSLIVDYFRPEQRGRALAVFVSFGPAGYLIGIILGAWIAANYGWRVAFIALGLPGLAIAIVAYWVLKEPRHLPAFSASTISRESFRDTIGTLRGKLSYVYFLIAFVLYLALSYGAIIFFPSYLTRVLDVPLATVGTAFGAVAAATSFAGTISGGVVTDWLAKRDASWLGWLPALSLAVAWPLMEMMLMASSLTGFLIYYALASMALHTAIPAMFAAMHLTCGSRRRATAVALTYFVASLIGSGLGPVLTGAMSDAFTDTHGAVGLRYSLMIIVSLLLPCAWCMYRSSAYLKADTED